MNQIGVFLLFFKIENLRMGVVLLPASFVSFSILFYSIIFYCCFHHITFIFSIFSCV